MQPFVHVVGDAALDPALTLYSTRGSLIFRSCPLFLLIGLSLFFGYGLAKLEAPDEIAANNEIIASRAMVDVRTKFHDNATKILPEICFEIFTQDLPVNETLTKEFDELSSRILDRQSFSVLSRQSVPGELTANETLELLEFLPECGRIGLDIAKKFTSQTELDYGYIGDSLSFNWIRCDGSVNSTSSTLGNQIWGRPFVDRDRLKPDAQAASAIFEWRINNRELYEEYLESLRLTNGTLQIGARSLAFRQSLAYADGFGHCYPNSAAGAWFWFTVMTTIGYVMYVLSTCLFEVSTVLTESITLSYSQSHQVTAILHRLQKAVEQ